MMDPRAIEYTGYFDADLDGCVDRVQDLAGLIASLGLPESIKSRLLDRAEDVLAATDRGNGSVARDMLAPFIDEVGAGRNQGISSADAALLIRFAQNLVARTPGF